MVEFIYISQSESKILCWLGFWLVDTHNFYQSEMKSGLAAGLYVYLLYTAANFLEHILYSSWTKSQTFTSLQSQPCLFGLKELFHFQYIKQKNIQF